MKKCPNCGTKLYDGDKQCCNCNFEFPPERPMSKLSLAGFICSCFPIVIYIGITVSDTTFNAVTLIIGWIALLSGIVLSICGIALGDKKGTGFSTAGLAIGFVGIFPWLLFSMLFWAFRDFDYDKAVANNTAPTVMTPQQTEYVETFEEEQPHITFAPRTMYLGTGGERINLWSFSDDVPKMVLEYIKQNPDFGEKYSVECTIYEDGSGANEKTLNNLIAEGGYLAPDIYVVDEELVYKYVQGDMSEHAATYKEIGIDVDTKIKEADIAKYSVEVGSRNGEVVALGYQGYGGVMIYNAEIAKEVFGTDDPEKIEEITGAASGNWDKFFEAAEKLKEKGYAAVSGPEDIWKVCDNSTSTSWLVNGELKIDPNREKYFDIAKTIKDNGYSNNNQSWSDNWYYNMKGEGGNKVFAYFGPVWLINYVMIGNSGGKAVGEGTYGQWRVCAPPVGFFWSGSWILANKDTKQKEGVAELIEWITLDTSETGLQYLWANGLIDWDNDPETVSVKDAVASAAVMEKSDGTYEFCGGQDIFPALIRGNKLASGRSFSPYDEDISYFFKEAAWQYASGNIDKDEAINRFKQQVMENI